MVMVFCLSRLSICMLMGSIEQIPYFVLLVHAALLHLLNCLYLDPRVFSFLLIQFSPYPADGWMRVTGWVAGCWQGSTHYTVLIGDLKKSFTSCMPRKGRCIFMASGINKLELVVMLSQGSRSIMTTILFTTLIKQIFVLYLDPE